MFDETYKKFHSEDLVKKSNDISEASSVPVEKETEAVEKFTPNVGLSDEDIISLNEDDCLSLN